MSSMLGIAQLIISMISCISSFRDSSASCVDSADPFRSDFSLIASVCIWSLDLSARSDSSRFSIFDSRRLAPRSLSSISAMWVWYRLSSSIVLFCLSVKHNINSTLLMSSILFSLFRVTEILILENLFACCLGGQFIRPLI